MDGTVSEAIALAEKVRCDHNGVFGVRLYLGHDGHNECTLEDYDGEVGRGQSGRNLLEAVTNAMRDWRFRNLKSGKSWARATVEAAISEAVKSFGEKGDGLFNTACFENAINQDAYAELSGEQIVALLEADLRVVRLRGGSHWLLLPDGHQRFAFTATEVEREQCAERVG